LLIYDDGLYLVVEINYFLANIDEKFM